jgi:uncharacterized protein
MSRTFNDLKIGLDEDLAEKLQWLSPGYSDYRILKKSVDARQRHNPHWIVSVEVAGPNENITHEPIVLDKTTKSNYDKPLIVGSGPAGLFAALRLVERGIKCTLLERGSEANLRIKAINKHWRYGELDPQNNVCFGEGGAGLYSDGKLITRIKSIHIPYVMDRLIQFGAPEEIRWLANPHVGSDRIRRLIPVMRNFLVSRGCEIYFNQEVVELTYANQLDKNIITGAITLDGKHWPASSVILATGHSSEQIISHLLKNKVHIEGKSFAMGLRIEHPQEQINKIQYRQHWNHPDLGSANYRLAHHDHKTGIGVYSFCMCPGGYVLSSGTEKDGVVCNGMSNYKRNSPFANAAIVVSIDHDKNFDSLLGGLELRKNLEQKAYRAVLDAGGSGRELPAQKLVDFIAGKRTDNLRTGSSPSGAIAVRLDQILPSTIRQKLIEGLEKFNRNMNGFICEGAVLYGVESRTSCPVRITRDEKSLMSISHSGRYPAGEGAGYAGGITSAACDGIKIADQIFSLINAN